MFFVCFFTTILKFLTQRYSLSYLLFTEFVCDRRSTKLLEIMYLFIEINLKDIHIKDVKTDSWAMSMLSANHFK